MAAGERQPRGGAAAPGERSPRPSVGLLTVGSAGSMAAGERQPRGGAAAPREVPPLHGPLPGGRPLADAGRGRRE
eukprot:6728993-Pyramimonas_sp.AAC.1